MLGLLSPGSAKADVFFKSTPLTKLSPYKGKKPEIEKNLSQKLGNLNLKLGKVAPDFDSRFGGIKATGYCNLWLHPCYTLGQTDLASALGKCM